MKTAYVFGYEDLTEEEFVNHYEEKLFDAINNGYSFVVSDKTNADIMTQKYLKSMLLGELDKVIVYHLNEEPKFNAGFETIGNFDSQNTKVQEMLNNSQTDITWLRTNDKTSFVWKTLQKRKERKK